MKIDCGKYILNTDANRNMWIEEKFTGKDAKGNDIESTRRVAGYLSNFNELSSDFLKNKLCAADSDNLIDVLIVLRHAEDEIDVIFNRYKEELEKYKNIVIIDE